MVPLLLEVGRMAGEILIFKADPEASVSCSPGMTTPGYGGSGCSAASARLACLVLVCSKWPPSYGGPGIYYHRLLPSLASVAARVHIVTGRGVRPPWLDAGELPVTVSAIPRPTGAFTQQLFGARVAWHIMQQVRRIQGRVAVLFTGGNPMNGWRETAVALASSGVPVVVENVLMSGDDGPTIARCRLPWLTKLAAARIRCFCPVSTGLKQSLEQAFPRVDCQLLPYGIDLKANAPPLPARKLAFREELGLPPHGFVAVTLGNIHERKGQLPLVKAWIHWVKTTRLTDARLMIVGPSEDIAYRAELDRLLESESMAGSTVVFTGQVTDTGKYLSAADIYVSAAQAEGLPIAIVEALAYGLPVVCRWLSGVTGDFMFGGAVTPVYNWNDETFSGAILPMLDPLMRSAASADARHVAEMRFEVHSRLGRLRQLLS